MRIHGVVILLSLSVSPIVWADVACVHTPTQRLLSTFSHGAPGICVQNYVTNNPTWGYTAGDIEERIVTPTEREQLLRNWHTDPANPDVAKRAARAQAHQDKVQRLRQKLGLSAQEFRELQEALQGP